MVKIPLSDTEAELLPESHADIAEINNLMHDNLVTVEDILPGQEMELKKRARYVLHAQPVTKSLGQTDSLEALHGEISHKG
jgi:hypothetical protein